MIDMKSIIKEGSKRVKLHPRTISDIKYVIDSIWRDYLKKDDDAPLKGTIYVKDPEGAEVSIPVYYLSDFESQGAVYQIDANKPRNLYNLFMVVNPDESLIPSKKSLYNLMYHEIQHMMDLHTTSHLTQKEIGKYGPDKPETYWGHDFEFRAYGNEILEGIVNEYKDLLGKHTKEELLKSLKSLVEYFARSGQADEIAKNVLFSISSEESKDEEYPHAIQVLSLLKQYNPKKWGEFLKMFYSTIIELTNDVKDYYKGGELGEGKKFKKPRKYGQSYCKKTPCGDMGFSQKASCRPYKNCYK